MSNKTCVVKYECSHTFEYRCVTYNKGQQK